MAYRKSVDFLPEVFQTETNGKILRATLDQLVSEPELRRMDGFVGRRFNPALTPSDSYIVEEFADRQNYQLEPATVLSDSTGRVTFVSTYQDLIDRIRNLGGNVDDPSRLFSADQYNFGALFDYDKFVNYSSYYWLPNGADRVDVRATAIAVDQDIVVQPPAQFAVIEGFYDQTSWDMLGFDTSDNFIRNLKPSGYQFNITGNKTNPILRLARGGVYRFRVNQLGHGFFIQTEPGLQSSYFWQRNLSMRDVLGVENNGADVGTVVFRVPSRDAQDRFVNMPTVGSVDLVAYSARRRRALRYTELQKANYRELLETHQGVDGQRFIVGATVTFLEDPAAGQTPTAWQARTFYAEGSLLRYANIVYRVLSSYTSGRQFSTNNLEIYDLQDNWYDPALFDETTVGFDSENFDRGDSVPLENRLGWFRINIDAEGFVRLTSIGVLDANEKIQIESGINYGNRSVYRTANNQLKLVPPITANLDYLYYQDALDPSQSGLIELVDQDNNLSIDVNTILNSANYTSPNGVEFENGLRIKFSGAVSPDSYAQSEYYIEGVGSAIKLIDVQNLLTPETWLETVSAPFDQEPWDSLSFDQAQPAPVEKQYITINRSSQEASAWTRQNRWFHSSVIEKSNEYNQLVTSLDQNARAKRPIIEFVPNLQMYNFGQRLLNNVTVVDTAETDALSNAKGVAVQSSDQTVISGYYSDGVPLSPGYTVVFAADSDPAVRNRIWQVEWIIPENALSNRSFGFIGDGATTVFDLNFDITAPTRLTVLIDGVTASDRGYLWSLVGQDIVFAVAPPDRSNITVNYEFGQQIHLVPVATASPGDVILSQLGNNNQGQQWSYDGDQWIASQVKTSTNQAPLFELFDRDGIAFSDATAYPSSDYSGSPVFSYKIGSGAIDSELGLRLSYRSINNVGDIVFVDNLSQDVYTYEPDASSVQLPAIGSRLHQNINGVAVPINQWTRNLSRVRQDQVETFFATQYQRNLFKLNVFPQQLTADSIQVFVNNQPLLIDQYDIEVIAGVGYLQLNESVEPDTKIDVRVVTDRSNSNSFWEVPSNLQNNALNDSIGELTLGQLRSHILSTLVRVPALQGNLQGDNNLKDIGEYRGYGGTILQNAGAPHLANLFLNDSKANFVESLRYAQREYQRFKNQFQQLAYEIALSDPTDAVRSVDEILSEFTANRGEVFAFYHSDMVPFGNDYRSLVYTVTDPNLSTYFLSDLFDLTAPSATAVLVYLNGTQLVFERDYEFLTGRPIIELNLAPENPDRFANYVQLQTGDRIEIREYSNTNGCYIPQTPTKLGLYPTFRPAIVEDGYPGAQNTVIRGHDGSLTVAYGDHRDAIILELEKRIYNNIKARYQGNLVDVLARVPGAFRDTDYTKLEFETALSTNFNSWLGANGISFGANEFFDSNDPFSWNYLRFTNRLDGTAMPASSWRGLYRYYYDTDQPHIRPWEMLGFTERPDWWNQTYGPAPYTSGNQILWIDLEQGRIRGGDRAGIDPARARPGLNRIIPVNASGELLSPFEALAANSSINVEGVSRFGDGGPVETAWRQSSEYPFALQLALALLYPAEYFGLFRDTTDQTQQSFGESAQKQWYFRSTGTRQRVESVHGETVDGQVLRVNGYTTWISEHAHSQGLDIKTAVGDKLRGVQLRLAYKLGGYSDKRYLKIRADQASPDSVRSSVLIPDDDYQIVLSKSAPRLSITYSGVIVTRSGTGWSVTGYDTNQPYFLVEPPKPGGTQRLVRIAREGYNITVPGDGSTVIVPYGTVFSSKQEVLDFLIGIERYLTRAGFKFEQKDSIDSANLQDWWMAARQFLLWTQQGWEDDIAITLSPVGSLLEYRSTRGTVDAISNRYGSSRILSSNFDILQATDYTTNRDGRNFNLQTLDERAIYLADISVVDFEHVIVFNNATRFNDLIYQPELGNRQFRLHFSGFKSGAWDGTFGAPGFIVNDNNIEQWSENRSYFKGEIVLYKNRYFVASENVTANRTFDEQIWLPTEYGALESTLLPNLANRAGAYKSFYDFNNINLELDIDRLAKGLIGFQSRDYLTDLGISDTSQVNFYKGSISQKGSNQSLDKMLRARLDNFDGQANFYEQWAIRSGSYGTTANTQQLRFVLDQQLLFQDPSVIQFLDTRDVRVPGRVSLTPDTVLSYPRPWRKNFLSARDPAAAENDLPTAGYVRSDQVDYLAYDINDISTVIDSRAADGSRIWVANDTDQRWAVYRVSDSNVRIDSVTIDSTALATVRTFESHGLQAGEQIYIRAFSGTGLTGYYQVQSTVDDTTFTAQTNFNPVSNGTVDAIVYKLVNLRVDNAADITDITPFRGWSNGDQVYVDYANSDGWAVYERNNAYTNITTYLDAEATAGDGLGASVAKSLESNYLLSGSTAANKIQTYRLSDGALAEDVELAAPSINTLGFGTTLAASSSNWVAAGSPLSNGVGHVHLLRTELSGSFFVEQAITIPNLAQGAEFGASLAISDDARWLFVGSPGLDEGYVWIYQQVSADSDFEQTFIGDAVTQVFPLTGAAATVDDIYALKVINGSGKLLVPFEDYILVDNDIIFTVAPGIEQITINLKSYYTLLSALTLGNAIGDRFGDALATSTDGTQLLVGVPNHDDSSIEDTGRVFVIDRTVEKQRANGVSLSYSTVATIFGEPQVKIDDLIQDSGYVFDGVNTITFSTPPAAGSIISIESNNPVLSLTLDGSLVSDEPALQFGYSLDLCSNNCSLYVGAPSANVDGTDRGAVYRWINQGRFYGIITGDVENPTISTPTLIGINGFLLSFNPGDSLTDIVSTINLAAIPGVTALSENNVLTITSDSDIFANKLNLLLVFGNFFTDMGMQIYAFQQTILPPNGEDYLNFGQVVKVSQDATELAVSSVRGSTLLSSRFDDNNTIFDGGTTRFSTTKKQSGAVYVFQLLPQIDSTVDNPSPFVFAEKIAPGELQPLDQFGKSIEFVRNAIYIGAPGSDIDGISDRGAVFGARKLPDVKTWNVIRSQTPKVDLDLINSVYLYDRDSGIRLIDLDIIDAAKNQISGVARQELAYSTPVDPAMYGNSSSTGGVVWTDQHLGELWWDVSRTRWIDYEQDSVEYRAANWNFAFPGSTVVCYEWTASDLPPSNYSDSLNPDARPKSLTEFSTALVYDPISGRTSTRYYFWVAGKIRVPRSKRNRRISAVQVEQLIADPRSADVPFVAFLDSNSIALYNVGAYLNGRNVAMVIDYDVRLNRANLHNEYQLISEGDAKSQPSTDLLIKLIQSLAGSDNSGNLVPDIKLPMDEQIGISVRPRQTMFKDRRAALRDAVDYINRFLITKPLVYLRNLDDLFANEPLPDVDDYDDRVMSFVELGYLNVNLLSIGTRVLVEADSTTRGRWVVYQLTNNRTWFRQRVQAYRNSKYMQLEDWVDSTVTVPGVPARTVNFEFELERLSNVQPGDFVKIRDNGLGLSRVVMREDSSWRIVQEQSGTVQINNSIWKQELNRQGWDADGFDLQLFDDWPTVEIQLILRTLYDQVFVEEDLSMRNKWFIHMMRYALSEQKTIDWLFKTSLLKVEQRQRAIKQIPVFQQDKQDLIERYISEVKPYHSKIDEYVLSYDGNEVSNQQVSDFDLPPYYSVGTRTYRSPDGSVPDDDVIFKTEPYRSWVDNYKLSLVAIDVYDGGFGFFTAPEIIIEGGGGTGAVARAIVANGRILRVEVINPGYGYITTPDVYVQDQSGSGAILSARLDNNLVRSADTVIRFDRLPTTSGWMIQFRDYFGNPVDVRNERIGRTFDNFGVIDVVLDLLSLGEWIKSESDLISYPAPVPNFRTVDDASGRVYFYDRRDSRGWTTALLELFIRSLGFFVGVNGLDISGSTVVENGSYASYERSYFDWIPGFSYIPGDIIVHQRTAWRVTNSFVAPAVFDVDNLTSISADQLPLIDRIHAFYQPKDGMLGNDIAQLINGVGYDANWVSGANFNQEPGFDVGLFDLTNFDNSIIGPEGVAILDPAVLDQVLFSQFNDLALGTRPEDIITAGGSFLEPKRNTGPEEMVAGSMYDSLMLRVYSLATSAFDVNTKFSPELKALRYNTNGVTRRFAFEDSGKHVGDYFMVNFKNAGLRYRDSWFTDNAPVGSFYATARNRAYSVDWVNREIVFPTAPAAGDVLSIINIGQIGENIVAAQTYDVDANLVDFDLVVPFSKVADIMILINGLEIFDFTFSPGIDPDITVVTLANPTEIGDHVHIIASGDFNRDSLSRINTQIENISSTDRTIVLDQQMKFDLSKDTAMLVEINDLRLRPGNSEYYIGDGSTQIYQLPTSAGETYNSLTFAEVQVWKDGIRQDASDYDLSPADGISIPVVTFFVAPESGSRISITYTGNAEYFYNSSNNTLRIRNDLPIPNNSLLAVTGFSTHDVYDFKTRVFVGTDQLTSILTLISGYDNGGFDTVSFDGSESVSVLKLDYNIDPDQFDASRVFVTLDGRRQIANVDYTLSAGVLSFANSVTITNTTVVVITWMSANIYSSAGTFQLFQGLDRSVSYNRVAALETTVLAKDLALTDQEILVQDASVLDQPSTEKGSPGVIFVGGERITYYQINGNTLTQIRRGTQGTGAPVTHFAGSTVVNGSGSTTILDAEGSVWYDTPGAGLQGSNTRQARFVYALPGLAPNL